MHRGDHSAASTVWRGQYLHSHPAQKCIIYINHDQQDRGGCPAHSDDHGAMPPKSCSASVIKATRCIRHDQNAMLLCRTVLFHHNPAYLGPRSGTRPTSGGKLQQQAMNDMHAESLCWLSMAVATIAMELEVYSNVYIAVVSLEPPGLACSWCLVHPVAIN